MKHHRFSGWPGAYCLDCGSDDPMENALALGWINFLGTDEDGIGPMVFDTPEHEAEVKAAMECQAKEADGG